MSEGGSFWATFGGDAPEASALEKLLQSPSCSVEALLDQEEVIQEFKTGNAALVARLSQADGIQVLMECITLEPPPQASHARCYRYPFVAVELMTCAPAKFMEVLVSAESNAMDLLWSFVETEPSQVNPVLAGYFSRTATALMSKYQKEVLEYLRRRGDRLMDDFLKRIHFRSLAELFARLLSGEQEAQVAFQTTGIVARLLQRWEEESNTDAQENITLVLAELLNQKESLCWMEDLTQQLTAPSTVQFLIDHVFRGRGVPPAMLLLTTVIVHTTTTGKDGEVATSTLSPLASPARVETQEDSTTVDEPVVEAAAARTPSQSQLGSEASEWMERRRIALMQEVAGHFPRLRQLLDQSLTEAPSSIAMPQGSIRALGGTTLEVVSLIATVTRSGLDVILEAMLKNQLLPRCVEVFFRHPWSTLLHNSVKQLLLEVLGGSDALRRQLAKQLLQEARLAERIVEEFQAERQWKSCRQRHARVGYMGHLFLVAGALRASCAEELKTCEGWSEVLLEVEETQKLHNEQLGGGVPASDRGLASSKVPERESKDTEQVAVCPAWSQRVSGNFLQEEPVDLGAEPDRDLKAIPNGQAEVQEDAFDPDAGGISTPSSTGASWASFPDTEAQSFPSFASFPTEWPAEPAPAPSSDISWASFEEPKPVQAVAALPERPPAESESKPVRQGASDPTTAPTRGTSAQQAQEVFGGFPEAVQAPPQPKSAPLSEELGAENLFALIGETLAPERRQPSKPAPTPPVTVPKQPSASTWPPIPTTPWSNPGAPMGGYGAANTSATDARDRSWIGDFDPLAESKATPASGAGELSFLDFPWPSKSATSH